MSQGESTFIELICPESWFAFDLITNFISETLSNLQRRKRAGVCREYRNQIKSQQYFSLDFFPTYVV